ncbi:MAG TPA: cation:proton antiporter [Actinophytocola sp.]|uniref:cation:proton antiporter domain-containing protein n=1 Tax=Actinophytocola sp. TaxID=1872138 RepID=UPI002F949E1B
MVITLGIAGVLALFAALLPRVLRDRPLSMPVVLLVIGVLLGLLPWSEPLDPREHVGAVQTFTEIGLLVALAGAGLKADRPLGRRSWSSTWRLLAITMPLSILAVAGLGSGFLGLDVASALLLGAALAPTDPVLASDVQVPEPHAEQVQGPDNEVRFALTTEAGLNDGLAMPFVLAALAVAAPKEPPLEWGITEVAVPLVAGLAIGWVCGKVLGWLMFRADSERVRLGEYSDGLVVLVIAFLPFALSELVGGYGFLAVFVTAAVVRASERSHGYHAVLHEFGEQLERLFVTVALVALGVALGSGLLGGLRLVEVLVAVAVVLVVRPVLGTLALIGAPTTRPASVAVAFFGVRGVGTFFYLAFGAATVADVAPDAVWRTAALAVALSVVVHGVSSGPAMAWLERRGAHERVPD